ncbi:MAG TPA: serine O-acetyltransferase EpsC [Labilithrix sp.]|nr:serine O-acetyltransferase EpsC [Labilithrix sp.]
MGLFKQLVSDAFGVALTRNGPAPEPGWKPGVKDAVTTALVQDGYAVLALSRLRDASRRWHVPGANRVLRLCQTAIYSIEIGNQVTLGEGVNFAHTLGIVIGGDAKIGARVKFLGNNTVGTAKDNGYPVIEDDVVIGCGARILGPIRVGRGALIGANAVVVHDVPAGAIVAGIPAKVIKYVDGRPVNGANGHARHVKAGDAE